MDLRTKPAPVAPAAASRPLGGNQLPLPTGSVLSLSPEEQRGLEQLGWKEGDPVPNLTEAIEQIRQEEARVMPDPNLPVVKPSQVVNLEDLPPERQAELAAQVRQAIEDGKELERRQAEFVSTPSDPSVNRAIETVQAGAETFNVELKEPDGPPQELETAAAVKTDCENCGWNAETSKAIVEVTDLDKQNFLAMLIGDVRFVREYSLFGGNVAVAFRSLTQQELDMCITQASFDASNGEIAADYDLIRRARNYELALALHRLKLGDAVISLPYISEVVADAKTPDGKPQTKVKALYDHVMKTHLHKEALFRAVQHTRDRFVQLQGRLEANMHNPDFYKGIVPHA